MAFPALWRSRTALLLAIGVASSVTLPILAAAPSYAQFRTPRPGRDGGLLQRRLDYRLPEGTVIPTRYEDAERIIVKPDETNELSLTVVADVRSPGTNRVVIPAGSVIEGELQPDGSGIRFVADEVYLADQDDQDDDRDDDRTEDERDDDRTATWDSQDIEATSDRLTDREIITEESDPDILRGAAIGGVAAVILSEILGDIDILEVLGGAGLGVLAEILISDRDQEEVEVIIIEDSDDLDLTLQADFVRASS